jgi:hypothetical protein
MLRTPDLKMDGILLTRNPNKFVNERYISSAAESFRRAGQLIREPASLKMSRGDISEYL